MNRKTHRLVASLALIAGLGIAAASDVAGKEEPKAASDGVVVLLEVWRVPDAGLIQQIEALTDRDPAGAEAVQQVLAASDKAVRVSRFVTPTQFGKPMKHSDRTEKAFVAQPPTTGGRGPAHFGGFGGFSTEGSAVTIVAQELADARIEIQTRLKVTVQGEPRQMAGGTMIPPGKFHAEIDGSVAGASGATRMFASHTTGANLLVVFVQATRL